MERITQVTQKDINNGEPQSPGTCPIAMALHRTDKYFDVSVGELNIEYYPDQTSINPIKKRNTMQLYKKIYEFDSGIQMEPFSIIEYKNSFDVLEEE